MGWCQKFTEPPFFQLFPFTGQLSLLAAELYFSELSQAAAPSFRLLCQSHLFQQLTPTPSTSPQRYTSGLSASLHFSVSLSPVQATDPAQPFRQGDSFATPPAITRSWLSRGTDKWWKILVFRLAVVSLPAEQLLPLNWKIAVTPCNP